MEKGELKSVKQKSKPITPVFVTTRRVRLVGSYQVLRVWLRPVRGWVSGDITEVDSGKMSEVRDSVTVFLCGTLFSVQVRAKPLITRPQPPEDFRVWLVWSSDLVDNCPKESWIRSGTICCPTLLSLGRSGQEQKPWRGKSASCFCGGPRTLDISHEIILWESLWP